MKKNKMIYLECRAKITAAEGDGPPRFEMTAYTGKPILVAWWDSPLVIDLKGIDLSAPSIPIFYGHNMSKGVGHTETVTAENGELRASGRISRATEEAKEVLTSARNGFPWQASVGGYITSRHDIAAGESETVNGRKIDGPAIVADTFELKEISFVELGADDDTTATVSAGLLTPNRKGKEMEKDVLKAEAVDSALNVETGTPDINQVVASAVGTAMDELKAQLKKEADERRRVDDINARDASFGNAELKAKALAEGWSADKFELEALRASRSAVPFVPTGGSGYCAEQLEAAALLAAGLPEKQVAASFHRGDDVIASAERVRGIGLREMLEIAASLSGKRLDRFSAGRAGSWLSAAYSTAGVSGILSDTLNKGLLQWYAAGDQGWRKIVSEISVKDFKTIEQSYFTTSFPFEEVAPGGEIKHGSAGDETFTNKARTYGVQFVLSREMLINDDLGAFMVLPQRLGQAAARTLGKRVWAAILANPVGKDGSAFFSTGHKNYVTGADSALGIDSLSNARAVFAKQTDQYGESIDVLPAFLAVPPELGTMAELLYSATYVNENTTANKPKPNLNPNAGKLEPIVSAQLSNTNNTGSSETAYYLFADPNVIPAIQVAYLNGVKVPQIDKGELLGDRLGIGYRAYFDYGVALIDYRGAVKVKGAA